MSSIGTPSPRLSGGKIEIFDVTLREGEQAAGVALSPSQKSEIALLLDRAGVSEIEAGLLGLGKEEDKALKRIRGLKLGNARLSVAALIRKDDITRACDLGYPTVNLIVPVSANAARALLNKTPEMVLREACAVLERARANSLEVNAAFVDASRTRTPMLISSARALARCGVRSIIFCDSAGIMRPAGTRNTIRSLRRALENECRVGIHLHNDFGLATANALAAAEAGAHSLQVTVNGIGERAGISSLAEVVLGCELLLGRETAVKMDHLTNLARTVRDCTGLIERPYAPGTGMSTFWCETGIPASTLNMPKSPFLPISGKALHRSMEVSFGKHTGRRNLKAALGAACNELSEETVARLVRSVKGAGEGKSERAGQAIRETMQIYERQIEQRRVSLEEVRTILARLL